MEFSRPELWRGLLFPSPRDLPDPGTDPGPPASQADAFPSDPQETPIYFAYGSVYVSTLPSLSSSILSFPSVSTSLFSMSVFVSTAAL